MSKDSEKSSEKFNYNVKYGNLNVKIDTKITQIRNDNGDKDTFVHRDWTVTDNKKNKMKKCSLF